MNSRRFLYKVLLTPQLYVYQVNYVPQSSMSYSDVVRPPPSPYIRSYINHIQRAGVQTTTGIQIIFTFGSEATPELPRPTQEPNHLFSNVGQAKETILAGQWRVHIWCRYLMTAISSSTPLANHEVLHLHNFGLDGLIRLGAACCSSKPCVKSIQEMPQAGEAERMVSSSASSQHGYCLPFLETLEADDLSDSDNISPGFQAESHSR